MRFLIVLGSLFLHIQAMAASDFLDDLDLIKDRSVVLKIEHERLRAADENLLSKKLFWTPSLTAGVGRQKVSSPSTPANSLDYDYWKADATWNLFRAGGDLDSLKAASAAQMAQKFKLLDEDLKQEVKAAELIFHALYLQDVIASAQELVRLRDESQHIVEEKYKQGKSHLQEVTKSEVDRTQQVNRLRSLQIEQLDVQAQWKALLQAPLKTKRWPFMVNQKLPSRSTTTPRLNELAQTADSLEATLKSTRTGHWPSLDLTAEYLESPLKDRSNQQWSANLFLTIPLWDQFSTSSKVATAYADWISARGDFEQADRLEKAQREVLEQRVEWARQSLRDAQNNLSKSEKLYRDMLKSFRYGRMSMNELLLEQNRLIDSAVNLSQSQWDFHKIMMESCAIAGQNAKGCFL